MPVKEFTYTRNGRTWTERRWVHERKRDTKVSEGGWIARWDEPDNFTKEEWAAVKSGKWEEWKATHPNWGERFR